MMLYWHKVLMAGCQSSPMSVKYLIHFKCKADSDEVFQYIVEKIKQKMDQDENCERSFLYQDVHKPNNFLLYEDWNSTDAQESFLQTLEEEGLLDQLKETLTEPIRSEVLPNY